MSMMSSLKCLECGQEYSAGEKLLECRKNLVVCEVTGSELKQRSEASEALEMPKLIPAPLKDFEKTFLSR